MLRKLVDLQAAPKIKSLELCLSAIIPSVLLFVPQHITSGEEPPAAEGWVAIPGAKMVSDKREKKTTEREEQYDRLETEEEENLGDVAHQFVDEVRRSTNILGSLALRVAKCLTILPSSPPSSDHGRAGVLAL
ncbi:unnamed protein product [Cyprideis torosa]|uniref:Uncharacterized protein n=1 Tax=Cyprideis torosa TaxID=163714 RepID=A0A7R8W7S3_9CRUS|nr:unnamed protein product [Cyprideis torosa]CAG0883541.1 unnamed protein product [Cyprideis torosa]